MIGCIATLVGVSTLMSADFSFLVVDAITDNPLRGCIITVNNSAVDTTDSMGRFTLQFTPHELESPEPGTTLNITIALANYKTQVCEINDVISKIIIQLEPVIYPYSPVFVEGDAHKDRDFVFASGSYVLNTVQVESSNSTAEAINLLPGIIIKSYGGPAGVSTASLLGGQADRIAILLNGVMLNSDQNGSADISQIPHALLENMNFYPQGSSARFGSSAMTGVINLKPKSGESFYSHTIGNYHQAEDMIQISLNRERMRVSASTGRFRYRGRYFWEEDESQYDFFQNQIDQRFYYLTGNFFLPDSTHLKAQVLDVLNDRKLSGYIYAGPDLSDMIDRLRIMAGEVKRGPITFRWNQKLNLIDYVNPPVPAPPVSAHHQLTTSDYMLLITKKHLNYQIMMRIEESKSTNSLDTGRVILTSSIDLDHTISNFEYLFSFRTDVEKQRPGLTAGEGTVVYHSNIWQGQSSLTISNNFKRPGFNDLYWVPFGNPNLKVERSVNFTLRSKFDFNWHGLDVNLFYIKYNDLIQWTPSNTGVVWSPENIPNSESIGYNFIWQFQKNPIFRISLSLLKNDTYYHSPDNEDLTSKPLRYSPEYIFSICHSTYFKGVIITSDVKSVSSRIYFYDYPEDRSMPAYTVYNMGVSKDFTTKYARIIIGLTVHNLSDIQFQTIHGYPEPGRSFILKTTIKEK